ncbi:MAG: CRISPR-associated endonuclease Cas1 [Thermoleophilia bacterium]|jgi:CRISPR-associated protein Cas1
MANLYLTEQGAVLRKTGDRLIVDKDDVELLEVECFKVDAVFLFGGVHVTTPALTELLSQGISLTLLTRDGRLKGRLVPPLAKNVLLRAAQYERRLDSDFCLALARMQIEAKVSNGAELLARHARNHPDVELAGVIDRLRVEKAKIVKAASMSELLGFEGIAARTYFEGFGRAFRRELGFPGRRRRPPTDPVNALLSLGYVMLSSEILAQLEGTGFDPYLGFYHQLDYGRPSLALDVVEEFRMVVDQLVLRLTNLGVMSPDDFEPAPSGDDPARGSAGTGGIRLKPPALREFLSAYGKHLEGPITDGAGGSRTTTRGAIRRQVERLAAHVAKQEPYEPCLLRP